MTADCGVPGVPPGVCWPADIIAAFCAVAAGYTAPQDGGVAPGIP